MKRYTSFALYAFVAMIFAVNAAAQNISRNEIEINKPASYKPVDLKVSPKLDMALQDVVKATVARFKDRKLAEADFAVTVIDLTNQQNILTADHRGEERIYPASVVKMFYMATLFQQIEDGKIVMTKELERGLKDMIVDSSNEATQYIVDVLTQTSSGGELPQKEFELWSYRRNRMNRYYTSMGYTNININQKTHCEDAYGVEQQFRNYKGENRNMITTNASARLIAEIASGRIVNAKRSGEMMEYLKRDAFAEGKAANSQAINFSGKALIDKKIAGAKLWSKAGWTSSTRHDAAYIETPDGLKFAVAVYTVRHADEKEIIPAIVGGLIDKLREK